MGPLQGKGSSVNPKFDKTLFLNSYSKDAASFSFKVHKRPFCSNKTTEDEYSVVFLENQ